MKSIQIISTPYVQNLYEFCNNFKLADSPWYTIKANIVLSKLGFQLPHREELQVKVQKECEDFKKNYTQMSLDDQMNYLTLYTMRTFMFPIEGREMREQLKQIALELHASLPDDNDYLQYREIRDNTIYLSKIMTMYDKANPKIDCYLSPANYSKEKTQQEFILRLNNSSPFKQKINITNIETHQGAEEEYKVEIIEKTEEIIYLEPHKHVDVPVIITRKTNETTIEKIEVKLSIKTPVTDIFHDGVNKQEFGSETYFEITIKEEEDKSTENTDEKNDKKKALIAGLVTTGALVTVGGGITIGTIVRKKKKEE
ncbi:MAG: hypothetical protein EAX90_04195 [Candidatus Heimdallarchaeota archaeon]|nr:hypothetical protein [Candidatus Heimdallarchaeota archaeon]